jgi:hypothetical protein
VSFASRDPRASTLSTQLSMCRASRGFPGVGESGVEDGFVEALGGRRHSLRRLWELDDGQALRLQCLVGAGPPERVAHDLPNRPPPTASRMACSTSAMGTRQDVSASGGRSQQATTSMCGVSPVWTATSAVESFENDPSNPSTIWRGSGWAARRGSLPRSRAAATSTPSTPTDCTASYGTPAPRGAQRRGREVLRVDQVPVCGVGVAPCLRVAVVRLRGGLPPRKEERRVVDLAGRDPPAVLVQRVAQRVLPG